MRCLSLSFSFPFSADHERDRPRSAYFVLHVQNLRTILQIRTTKAERFALETHHFEIQHAEITGRR